MQQVCKAKKCGAVFSVGAAACPQCGSADFGYDHTTPAAAVDGLPEPDAGASPAQ